MRMRTTCICRCRVGVGLVLNAGGTGRASSAGVFIVIIVLELFTKTVHDSHLKINKMHLWPVVLLGISLISIGNALECYVCKNQEGNVEKCLNTIKTCEHGEDTCLSEIKWGSTPYWNQGAKKQFYVSKRCSTKRECERIKHANMPDCSHIWYLDWKCSECCQGDRCNYYIISGSSKAGITMMTLLTPLIVLWRML